MEFQRVFRRTKNKFEIASINSTILLNYYYFYNRYWNESLKAWDPRGLSFINESYSHGFCETNHLTEFLLEPALKESNHNEKNSIGGLSVYFFLIIFFFLIS